MPDFGRWSANGGDPSLNEINRTDQFLDALASQQPVYATDRGEAELAYLLAGWRDDIRETPMGDVLTTEQAEQALDRVTSSGRRRRLSFAVVGSAAAAVLCLGGFGAVVAGSGPGDALYGLRTMLFGQQEATRDDAVVLAAQTEMAQVQQLIKQGDWQAAQNKLQTVTTAVATVNDVERKQELVSQWQELTVKVQAQNPAATIPPGAPAPTFPDLPAATFDPAQLSTGSATPSESTTPSVTSPTPGPSQSTEPSQPSETPATTPGSETPGAPGTSPAPVTSPPAASQSPGAAPQTPTSTSVISPAPTSTVLPSPTPSRAPAATSSVTVQSSTTTVPTSTSSQTPAASAAPSTTTVAPRVAAEQPASQQPEQPVSTFTAVPPLSGRGQTAPRWDQVPPSGKLEPSSPTTTTFVPVPVIPNLPN